MQFDSKKTVYLIDGSSFLYRAYYGMRPMHNTRGEPIHAIYNFCRMIKKLVDQFGPEHISLVWDSKGKTERHEIYEEYKANRQAAPSDLFVQKGEIQKFADLVGLHQCMQAGVEADDLLFSLAKDFEEQGFAIVLVTLDKDLFQLLSENLFVYDSFKDTIITKKKHEEKLGFAVDRMPLYFSLLGDSSDNIPGVRGIGKKGATDIAQQFATLDDVYNNMKQIEKPKTRNHLLQSKENAYLSLKLFSLRYHKLNLKLKDLNFDIKNWQGAREFFAKHEFKSLLNGLGAPKVVANQQTSIFDVQPKADEFFADAKGYKFIGIVSEDKLADLCAKLSGKFFAIDTETTGLDPLQNDLIGVSICYQKGEAFYIPFGHEEGSSQLNKEVVFKHLKPILEDSNTTKCLHNAKFDELVFYHAGINLEGIVFDTMLAANLVTESWQRVGLKALSERYFDDRMLSFADVVKANKLENFAQVGLDLAIKYSAADAHQTFLLYELFVKKLKDEGADKPFYDIEMPLAKVLFEMEKVGIYLDIAKIKNLGMRVSAELVEIERDIRSLTGVDKRFNLNSPRQIEDLLFNQLNLPPQKKSAKRTSYSTDHEVLNILAEQHPVPGLILKYRELYKLKTTYIEALPTYVNKHDGRVHTSFSQIAAATGRLASSDPNLQNIPTGSGYGGEVRAAFKPIDGNVFISADYSQIELRVLAYLSQDENLVEAFKNGLDIHSRTAALLFETEVDSVTNDMRQIGKRINFSVLYGLTPYGLSKDLKIPLSDAKKYIEKFFEQYPGVRKWMDSVIATATEKGYVETLWGRKRFVPGLQERNKNLYEAACRIAVNTVAQGTAAEIVKQGMLNVQKLLQGQDAKMLLQIHDELLISVNKKEVDVVEQQVKNALEQVVQWNIPLVVTVRHGQDWQEVTK